MGAGLELVRGDAVVVLDADLQDPPAIIGRLIERWREGFEVVAARRTRRRGVSVFKKVVGYLFYRILTRITNVHIPSDTGDFALLDRRVVDVLLACKDTDVLARPAPLRRLPPHLRTFDAPARLRGKSKYTLGKLFKLAFNGILTYSDVPLRLGLYLGSITLVGTALLGLGSLGWAPERRPDAHRAAGTGSVLPWIGAGRYAWASSASTSIVSTPKFAAGPAG